MSPIQSMKLITKETLIPIGLALSLIAPVFLTAVWINNKLGAIDNRLVQIELRLYIQEKAIEQKLNNQMVVMNNRVNTVEIDRWTIKDQIIWAQSLQIKNGDIVVPLEFALLKKE